MTELPLPGWVRTSYPIPYLLTLFSYRYDMFMFLLNRSFWADMWYLILIYFMYFVK